MQDISLHILDIIQNSIKAEATAISIVLSAEDGFLNLMVKDNGIGMDQELLQKATDPFVTSRTTRRVGLGLPLLKDSAELAGGKLEIRSKPGEGTEVVASFRIDHIDRRPLGDLAETIISVVMSEPSIELEIELSSQKNTFVFNTAEIKNRLDGVSITELDIINWLKEYLKEGITETFGGVLDEVDS